MLLCADKQRDLCYDGKKSDVWSCGIVLFAMLCGHLPFEDANTHKLYTKILT
jgi:5'-AMP-activated protein kinase catalytic alpha subunit